MRNTLLCLLTLTMLLAGLALSACDAETTHPQKDAAGDTAADDDRAADNSGDEPADGVSAPAVTDEAYLFAGPTGEGAVVLPNGRLISPVGDRVTIKRFPMSLAMNPAGDRLYVATTRTPALFVVDPVTMETLAEAVLSRHFGGMTINSGGTRLYVGGANREVVFVYELAGDTPVLIDEIDAYGYPTDVVLSGDEQTMYVTLAFGKRVKIVDLASGLETGSLNSGYYPYAFAVAESIGRGVVSNWGTRSVSVFDMDDDGRLLADIDVGKNPEGLVLAPDGRSAYVACSDTDDVYKVDLLDLVVTEVIPLYPDEEIGFGAIPTALALTADNQKLLVTASGFNSLDVIDVATGQVQGRIPTEWYPTDVLPHGDTLYVLAAKGTGAGPGNVNDPMPDPLPVAGGKMLGSVEAIEMPDDITLATYTEMVKDNNERTSRFYDDQPNIQSPIPNQPGASSEQIKHVVFILKENKTFDQVLSDVEGVDGDPSLLIYGDHYTPNIHALSREFTVMDNYYSESHESDLGHAWATQVVANDYVEKNWAAPGWTSLTGVEPASIPDSGTVFHHMLENDVTFRVYGEIVGTVVDIEAMAPHIDFNFGFYNMAISDRLKAAEAIREWEAGIFPQFIFIALPNDHSYGTDAGSPTMDYMVADNDAGVGMIVDWIAKSEHWGETAIFITEDDPQSGVDHIDAHRTPFTVISPYAKRGYVCSIHYSMASMWLTIERILGLPPVTNYDRYTAPMYDAFQMEPVLETDFAAIPSNIPYAENPADLPFADYCSRQNWGVPDQVERISEVVWAYMKPGVPYPHHLGVAPSEIEGEDEEAKGAHFAAMKKAYLEYGRANGLFDPEISLVDRPSHPH